MLWIHESSRLDAHTTHSGGNFDPSLDIADMKFSTIASPLRENTFNFISVEPLFVADVRIIPTAYFRCFQRRDPITRLAHQY